ncbi:MAG: ABC transporter permease [Acidobacteriota bacterium]
MAEMMRELRVAFRSLVRSPVFSLVVILTMALAVGANTAIFSVVNAVLLRPLPYPEADRLITVWQASPAQGAGLQPVAPADYYDYREATAFEGMTGYHPWVHTLTGGGEPVAVRTGVVDEAFFGVVGVPPAHGRTFRAEEIHASGEKLVVLGHDLWQGRYGGRENVLGEALLLDGEPYSIIGVMPKGYDFPYESALWRPIHLSPETARRDFQYLRVAGRLAPEATQPSALTELQGIAERLEQAHPETNRERTVRLSSLAEQTHGDLRPALLVLVGAVAMVLLIACVNLAGLMLARGVGRQNELAVRSALGASRRQISFRLLLESLLLAFAGGAIGLMLAAFGVRWLVSLSHRPIPGAEGSLIDGRVLWMTLGVVIAAGFAFGLLPALRLSRPELKDFLRAGSRSTGTGLPRLRATLVVCQVGLAVILLVGAGLLIRTFLNLRQVEPGFRTAGVLAAQIALPPARYGEAARTNAFIDGLLEAIGALPGVRSASLSLALPMNGGMTVDNVFSIEGRETSTGRERVAFLRPVSPGFFDTLGIQLLAGRTFDKRDRELAQQVVVVNRALIESHFPQDDPIGEFITVGASLGSLGGFDDIPREIVGVVDDIKHTGLSEVTRPEIYLPLAQGTWRNFQLAVRSETSPLSQVDAMREAVWALDESLPVTRVRLLEEDVADSVAQPRFSMILLTLFAGLACLLALVGVYGLVAFTVARRSHEMGVRMALGARRRDVLSMIFRQGMTLVGVGLILGAMGAFGLSRLLGSLLFGTSPTDWATFAWVLAIFAVVAWVATAIPAHRATRVDPVTVLRET